MHSNVVALTHPTELRCEPLLLSVASARFQRAVVAWADHVGQERDHSVLRLVERSAIANECTLLVERAEPAPPAVRFAGRAVSALHRSIADRLLTVEPPLKPVARCHVVATGLGTRELRSLILPFGRLTIVQFDD